MKMRLIMCTGTKLHAFPLPPNLQSMIVGFKCLKEGGNSFVYLDLDPMGEGKKNLRFLTKILIGDFRLHRKMEMPVFKTKSFYLG